MENILGIIVFILFIVLRAMGDRRKGMDKKAIPSKDKEIAPTRTATKKQQPLVKTETLRQPYLPKQTMFGGRPMAATTLQTASPPLGEDESNYDLAFNEGSEQTDNTGDWEHHKVYGQNEQEFVPVYSLTPGDLRQAIIWSEILENPRFRKKQIRR